MAQLSEINSGSQVGKEQNMHSVFIFFNFFIFIFIFIFIYFILKKRLSFFIYYFYFSKINVTFIFFIFFYLNILKKILLSQKKGGLFLFILFDFSKKKIEKKKPKFSLLDITKFSLWVPLLPPKFVSLITFSSELRFRRSWYCWKA